MVSVVGQGYRNDLPRMHTSTSVTSRARISWCETFSCRTISSRPEKSVRIPEESAIRSSVQGPCRSTAAMLTTRFAERTVQARSKDGELYWSSLVKPRLSDPSYSDCRHTSSAIDDLPRMRIPDDARRFHAERQVQAKS